MLELVRRRGSRIAATVNFSKDISMKHKTLNALKIASLVPLAALWLAAAAAQAQPNPAMAPSGSMPMGQMHKGAAGSQDMKAAMMMGMDGMQKMAMTGDTDKDFAMMMKMHHQQGRSAGRSAGAPSRAQRRHRQHHHGRTAAAS